jgi:hypothetical protein
VTLLTIYITAFFRTLEPQVPEAPAVAVLPGDGRSLAVVAGAGRWRISFGSRTDFILPPEAEVKAGAGDIVWGGETVFAILKEPHLL